MSKENWVDFKEIKKVVTMEMVLDQYGVNGLKKKKKSLAGRCPIHKGDNPTAFNVSISKNTWHCFTGCGKKGGKSGGNVIDFVVAMEGLPETSEGFRDAALKLKYWFMSEISSDTQNGLKTIEKAKSGSESGFKKKDSTKATESVTREISGNKTLTFELKNLDPEHEYLKDRDIGSDMARHFGIGFCKGKNGKGLMAGRVAIPIHNGRGELVAYAGRAVSEEQAEREGKYKLPPGFQKSLEVYNLHRAVAEAGDRGLVVVEGFFDLFRLYSLGISNTVALMGTSMSTEQERLILGATDRAVLMCDGDEAGRSCTRDVALRLVEKMFIRIARLPDGKQPDDMPIDELKNLVA